MSAEQEQQQDGNAPGNSAQNTAAGEVNPPRTEDARTETQVPSGEVSTGKEGEAPTPAGGSAQASDAGVPVVDEEGPPVPTLPDLRVIIEDDSGVFDNSIDPPIATRVGVVKGLIEKHIEIMRKYASELESGVTVDPSVIAAMDEARGKRDALNSEVASLKEKRTALKDENRQLRKKFLEMLKVQGRVEKNEKEIDRIKEFIERQDYKLMTEGVNLEAERKLMKDIKESMDNIKKLTGGFDPKDITEELRSLDGRMEENFRVIEDLHQRMLGLVSESQVHHQKFVDEAKKVREAEARKAYLQRRIALHGEMQKFWETQVLNAEAMDAADTHLTAATIKDRLLKEMEEAAKAEEQARRPRKGERGPGEDGGPTKEAPSGEIAPTDAPQPQPPSPAGPGPDSGGSEAPKAVPDSDEGGSA